MTLKGGVAKHPAQYSPEVIEALSDLIHPGERVHDPFAGMGSRLGALCDRLKAPFSGTDIEVWPDHDSRVSAGDSTLSSSYPTERFTVVTSPVYFANRISSDYVEGPTPTTKLNGRRSYGISLGRALDRSNAARLCRPAQKDAYYELHRKAVTHWQHRALVNVDEPLEDDWIRLLAVAGYGSIATFRVFTRRYRVPPKKGSLQPRTDQRAEAEVVIDARRMRLNRTEH